MEEVGQRQRFRSLTVFDSVAVVRSAQNTWKIHEQRQGTDGLRNRTEVRGSSALRPSGYQRRLLLQSLACCRN